MSRAVLLTLFIACASAATIDENGFDIAAPDGSTFRYDYVYHGQAGGWLKLHRSSASWVMARLTCRLEGARLASPIDPSLYSTMSDIVQETTLQSVFTGINALSVSSDYFSIEGIHISQMPLAWEGQTSPSNESQRCLAMAREGQISETSCDNRLPFFCFRPREGQSQMNECGTTDPEYRKSAETGSCYKVHTHHRATWFQAHTTCAAEGGHLVIFNSDPEAQFVSSISRGHAEYVFVGLVNWFQDDGFDVDTWKTVDGRTLEEAGYSYWTPGEPNNSGGEYCGAIGWGNGHVGFYDLSCYTPSPFVCEIDRPRIPVWW